MPNQPIEKWDDLKWRAYGNPMLSIEDKQRLSYNLMLALSRYYDPQIRIVVEELGMGENTNSLYLNAALLRKAKNTGLFLYLTPESVCNITNLAVRYGNNKEEIEKIEILLLQSIFTRSKYGKRN